MTDLQYFPHPAPEAPVKLGDLSLADIDGVNKEVIYDAEADTLLVYHRYPDPGPCPAALRHTADPDIALIYNPETMEVFGFAIKAYRLFLRGLLAHPSLDLKPLPVHEFRNLGYLQEANRRFFHPIGLALSVKQYGDDTMDLGPIFDCRGDPEGVSFAVGLCSQEKADYISDQIAQRADARKRLFGSTVQPITAEQEG